MPLLDELLRLKIRLVDYECIKEAPQKDKISERLVAFGRYAGIAGAFDFLRGIGEFLLEKKFMTPFAYVGSTYMYHNLESMNDALKKVSDMIKTAGLPK